ncbi:MAG: restriction endonuclease subunit S, partial [Vulcanimicrobiota bacterium]
EDFGNISVPLPPLPTQKAIANFLDRKTAAIDALIEKKEKLPKLLAEKRSALINQAVTKGLDPNVPMKDSGIPWIGEIPAHWEIIPLGYRVSMQGGSTPSKQDERFWGGDIPWVSPKDMKRFEIDDTIDKLTSDALEATSIRLIEPGATLVVVRGMILARKLPVGLSVVPCTINQDMKAIVPGKGLDARYLSWQLDARTQEAMSLIEEAGHGTKTFRTDLFTKMKILVPPVSEQREIITRLERKLESYDSVDGNTRVSIERLKEYRQSLITAAVTGQLEIPTEESLR